MTLFAKLNALRAYSDKTKLDVEIRFLFSRSQTHEARLDNRLKHRGDALQGFINDSGAGKRKPTIPERQPNLSLNRREASALETFSLMRSALLQSYV